MLTHGAAAVGEHLLQLQVPPAPRGTNDLPNISAAAGARASPPCAACGRAASACSAASPGLGVPSSEDAGGTRAPPRGAGPRLAPCSGRQRLSFSLWVYTVQSAPLALAQ